MRVAVSIWECSGKFVYSYFIKLIYVSDTAHKFSTVIAQATMNRPFPIRDCACPDDHFRFLVPQPGHVSKKHARVRIGQECD